MSLPELIVRLRANQETVAGRLSARERINIASVEDTALFESFLDEWLANVPSQGILEIDVTMETLEYKRSISKIIARISDLSG
jgi:hypothetical protein